MRNLDWIFYYNGRVYMLENYYDRLTILEGLGIHQSTLSRWMKDEGFPFVRIRGRVLFNKDEVKNYLVEHSHNHKLENFNEVVGS